MGTPSSSEARLISSPKPGMSLWQTLSMASGVTSRGAGPVPPVVTISALPLPFAKLTSVSSITLQRFGEKPRFVSSTTKWRRFGAADGSGDSLDAGAKDGIYHSHWDSSAP